MSEGIDDFGGPSPARLVAVTVTDVESEMSDNEIPEEVAMEMYSETSEEDDVDEGVVVASPVKLR